MDYLDLNLIINLVTATYNIPPDIRRPDLSSIGLFLPCNPDGHTHDLVINSPNNCYQMPVIQLISDWVF